MPANDRPFILGLTGGIASGKSAAAEHLASLGAYVVDADAISRALTAPGGAALPAIREIFGDDCFFPDGSLDRRKLGEIVFADEGSRRALEGVIHPAVEHQMLNDIEAAKARGEDVVVLNVPLLIECGMDVFCDAVWVMALDREEQVRRVMRRDDLGREQAEARVDCQMPLQDKCARASAVVRTDRPLPETQKELSQLYRDLLKRRPNA